MVNKDQKQDIETKMQEALNGKSKQFYDKVIGKKVAYNNECNSCNFGGETEPRSVYDWDRLLRYSSYGFFDTEQRFSNKPDKGILEAFVLIPEKEGLVEVTRIATDERSPTYGFLAPKYEEGAVESIQDCASRNFEQGSDFFERVNVLRAVSNLIPRKQLKAIKEKYRARILKGLRNTKFDRKGEIEVLWANVTSAICSLGFGAEDQDFVKALWEKSKTIPYGYLEPKYGAQVVLAQALMQKDPSGVVGFDYIRDKIHRTSLSGILSTLPVRNTDVEMQQWQIDRNYPAREVYKPIVEFIDKTLSG